MQILHRCASPRVAAKSTTPNNFQKLAGLQVVTATSLNCFKASLDKWWKDSYLIFHPDTDIYEATSANSSIDAHTILLSTLKMTSLWWPRSDARGIACLSSESIRYNYILCIRTTRGYHRWKLNWMSYAASAKHYPSWKPGNIYPEPGWNKLSSETVCNESLTSWLPAKSLADLVHRPTIYILPHRRSQASVRSCLTYTLYMIHPDPVPGRKTYRQRKKENNCINNTLRKRVSEWVSQSVLFSLNLSVSLSQPVSQPHVALHQCNCTCWKQGAGKDSRMRSLPFRFSACWCILAWLSSLPGNLCEIELIFKIKLYEIIV